MAPLHIHSRLLLIAVDPRGGWSLADEGTPASFETEFRFAIADDGNGNVLLTYASLDGQHSGDTWHETLVDAYKSATEEFGIEQDEWV